MVLDKAGFRTLKAKDSSEALRICTGHKGPIDLLLTDLVLVPRGFRIASRDDLYPQVHGHELAMLASTMRPDLRVAFMSGNPDRDLAGYGIKRGTWPFLSKPFSIDALVQFVKDAMAKDIPCSACRRCTRKKGISAGVERSELPLLHTSAYRFREASG